MLRSPGLRIKERAAGVHAEWIFGNAVAEPRQHLANATKRFGKKIPLREQRQSIARFAPDLRARGFGQLAQRLDRARVTEHSQSSSAKRGRFRIAHHEI